MVPARAVHYFLQTWNQSGMDVMRNCHVSTVFMFYAICNSKYSLWWHWLSKIHFPSGRKKLCWWLIDDILNFSCINIAKYGTNKTWIFSEIMERRLYIEYIAMFLCDTFFPMLLCSPYVNAFVTQIIKITRNSYRCKSFVKRSNGIIYPCLLMSLV